MTKVRLKQYKCNRHENTGNPEHTEITLPAKEAVGKEITIGIPVKPDWTWLCGTDVVWPVIDAEFYNPRNPGPPFAYVCRHQIEAGD